MSLFLSLASTGIIRTHGSKFTQFVIFAICNYDADFQDTFLDYLFRTFADPSSDAPLREACAAYVPLICL